MKNYGTCAYPYIVSAHPRIPLPSRQQGQARDTAASWVVLSRLLSPVRLASNHVSHSAQRPEHT